MSFQLIERQVIYDGTKVRLEIHRLEDEQGNRFAAEVVQHPGAVVVLAMLDAETVLLIRNYRHAVGQYLLELPAGTLNKGEPPMNAAGRELLEETGYLAKRIKPILSFFASPGILSEKLHLFAAYDLEQRTTALELGEDIEVRATPFFEAIEMIRDGAIQDSKTIAALLSYDRWWRTRVE
ncbi:MAG TPA: NUDIX hydrolase [Tepidisphaeraceae bacterium]|nr:NUDIX hydrolase [Tepidisphaeraceae bacterium]